MVVVKLIPRRAGSISSLYGAQTILKAKQILQVCVCNLNKKSLMTNGLRLIHIRIGFRASDFGDTDFSSEIKLVRVNRNRLLVRNRIRRSCSGHVIVCSCDPVVSYVGPRNSRQRRLVLCLAPRRDAPTALRSAPDLRWPRRDVPRGASRGNCFFFSTKHPSPVQ